MKKFAIITGASRGIGEGIAHYFAKQGYDLALIARNEDTLNQVKDAIVTQSLDCDVTVLPLDLSDPNHTYSRVKQCIEHKGRIDVVVNNAGIFIKGTLDISLDDFRKMQFINVDGVFAVAKAAAEFMKQQRSGYMFNIASILGKMTTGSDYGAYCTSKYAIVGFSDALMRELSPYGIKVTALCPSVVDTSMTRDFDMPNEEKIAVSDIVETVNYLLALSPAVLIASIDILCKPIVEANIT